MSACSQDKKRIESLWECSSAASSAVAARISRWYCSRTLSCTRRIWTHLRTRSSYAPSAAARVASLGLQAMKPAGVRTQTGCAGFEYAGVPLAPTV